VKITREVATKAAIAIHQPTIRPMPLSMDRSRAADLDRILSLKPENISKGTFSVEASPYLDHD
jgi:hypothetical protein